MTALKVSVIVSLIFPFSLLAQWNQVGQDIDGEAAGDQSGFSISMSDRNTLAIGAFQNDGNGIDAGQVRVYDWVSSTWTQRGNDIDGEAAGDESGVALSMPDLNTIAIGARNNDGTGTDAGHVRVFTWNGNAWTQKGNDIDGEAAGDEFGSSVSMPDTNTIAIGGRKNDGTALDAGHVRVFKWNGSAWVQMGNDIDGEAANDDFGYSVSMPDTLTLAVGAFRNDGNGIGSGHTRIYNWNGSSWIQKGNDIDGEAALDAAGISVSMSDSNNLAIGAYANDDNGVNSGHVRVYEWNGTTWNQKGADIDGEASGDLSGASVSMPSPNTVAIGAAGNNGNGTASGHARVYKWNSSNWIQLGSDIDGEDSLDQSGSFVFMPDTATIAIGAILNAGTAIDAGHVRVYRYSNITSLKEVQDENNFIFFPNPSNGELILDTKNSIGETIEIISINGAVLKEITISQNKELIDIRDLQSGLYFFRLGNEMQKIILTE